MVTGSVAASVYGELRLTRDVDLVVTLRDAEYVILRKLQYCAEGHSSRHLRDIAWMLRVSDSLIDHPLLDQKVHELGLEMPWQAAIATPLDA